MITKRNKKETGFVLVPVLIVGVIFVAIFVLGYKFISLQPSKKIGFNSDHGTVKIIGNFSDFIGEKSTFSGIAGSRDLCWKPPGCEERDIIRDKIIGDPDVELTDFENECFYGCLSHPDSQWAGERETKTLILTGAQVAGIINSYSHKSNKISNVEIEILDTVLEFELDSGYLTLLGRVSGQLSIENHRFVLEDLRIGKVSVGSKMQKAVESEIDSVLIDTLSIYGVRAGSSYEIRDGLFVMNNVEMPKGLITMDGEILVINLNVLPESEPSPKQEQGDGFTIQ